MRLFTIACSFCMLLAPAVGAQSLTNRWNPTGGAGAEAASQYRGVAVNQTTGRLYITSSATPVGVLYWDRTAWDVAASPIASPTGTFAPTKPDGTSWGAASPYGITLDADGNVYLYAFSDKKIYGYAADGTFRFKVSTDGGTTDLVSTQQARFLHAAGSYSGGTLAFTLVGATSPANVYRIAQTGGAGINTFAETMLFAEQNDGATNYAALTAPDGSVYVSSNGAGTTTRGLLRYLNTGGTWAVDPAWPAIRETVHDFNLTSDNKNLVVSIPGSRAFRVYNAVTGVNTGGASYGVSGAAMASGGAASFGRSTGIAVGHVSATRSMFEVIDAAQPLAADVPTAGALRVDVRGDQVRVVTAQTQTIRAEAFNVLGQRMAVLFEGTAVAGAPHTLVLDAALPAGLYLVRVTGAGVATTAPLVRVR